VGLGRGGGFGGGWWGCGSVGGGGWGGGGGGSGWWGGVVGGGGLFEGLPGPARIHRASKRARPRHQTGAPGVQVVADVLRHVAGPGNARPRTRPGRRATGSARVVASVSRRARARVGPAAPKRGRGSLGKRSRRTVGADLGQGPGRIGNLRSHRGQGAARPSRRVMLPGIEACLGFGNRVRGAAIALAPSSRQGENPNPPSVRRGRGVSRAV